MSLRAALAAAMARRRRARALRLYRRFLPSGGLCFDIGANVGDRTDMFVALGARVVAVEPQRGCIEVLRERFGDRIDLIEAALGSKPGQAELRIASYHTLSTLSDRWVDAVRESGRFAEFSWSERAHVRLTTLDALIAEYGAPDFCKIDVEGYELEVLHGLSCPLPALSFEFTPECLAPALQIIDYLDALGMSAFNYSWGESMRLALRRWVDMETMSRFLQSPAHNASTFGDVYVRL